MLGPIVRHKIAAAEKKLGVPLDYLRDMYQTAPDAFYAFTKLMAVSDYRKKLPAAPFHVARLVATLAEDCGPCVQTVVNQAKADAVGDDVLRAVLTARVADLPESLADVYRFAEAVVTRSGDEAGSRDRLSAVFGPEAVIELAMAIAVVRVYPVLKRGLGHASTCAASPVTV